MAYVCDRCGRESEIGRYVSVVTMDRVTGLFKAARYFDIRTESFWFCRDCIIAAAKKSDVMRPVRSLLGKTAVPAPVLSDDQLYRLFRREIAGKAGRYVVSQEEYVSMVRI